MTESLVTAIGLGLFGGVLRWGWPMRQSDTCRALGGFLLFLGAAQAIFGLLAYPNPF